MFFWECDEVRRVCYSRMINGKSKFSA